MSNHAGGHLLNKVFHILERERVFDLLGRPRAQEVVREITQLARHRYDCNCGEILEDVGPRLGLCQCCGKPADDISEGYCPECRPDDDFDEPPPTEPLT